MAIITKQIGFVVNVDTEAIAPASVNVWLYQLLNRIQYEHEIKSVTVDDVTVAITDQETVPDLPLGEDKPLE